MTRRRFASSLALLAMLYAPVAAAESRVASDQLRSASFAESRIGISPLRNIRIYLPPAYESRPGKRFPVIYYLGSFFETEATPFDSFGAKPLFDAAIARGLISDFILVTADYSTPAGSSWYVNSPITGNWEDFLVHELVPHIDATHRTIAKRDSRGLLGDSVGGHGAIRLAMSHPDVFASVYALQPLGTGASLQPTHSRPNFVLLSSLRSLDDLGDDHFSRIFTSIYQAFLPNTAKPPLFFDPPVRIENGRPQVDSAVLARFHAGIGLAGLVARHAEQLKSLRALKFDWGRGDTIIDHIHGAQALARQLAEYGVPHEAEEHSGGFRDRHWGEQGRVYTDVLPFFAANLDFGE